MNEKISIAPAEGIGELKTDFRPLKAIRKKCLSCVGTSDEVKKCETDCFLHPYRSGHRPKEKPQLTPMRAIRKECIDCSGGSTYEVKLCTVKKCPLYEYRSGHRRKYEQI